MRLSIVIKKKVQKTKKTMRQTLQKKDVSKHQTLSNFLYIFAQKDKS